MTTEVVGNCGFSGAPALPGKAAMLGEYLAASAPGLECRETSSAEYLRTFSPTSVYTVMQVGHNTLRLMTVGMARRAAPRRRTSWGRWRDCSRRRWMPGA